MILILCSMEAEAVVRRRLRDSLEAAGAGGLWLTTLARIG